jgi:NitT/TauT family transport system ATP-binding protein
MAIHIRNLNKTFYNPRTRTETFAIEDISLDIADGEFFCILGPSGCGKSTVLNILAGFESPSSGTVTIDTKPGDKPVTAMVFQEHALFPWLTVKKNILFGPSVRNMAKAEQEALAERFIGMVGLKGFEDKYPHELSGGMRQRVALARALANDPSVLLMDEPFASVDFQTRRLLQNELLRIWELTGKTIIYVTHDVGEAILLADRIAVITPRPGRIKRLFTVARPRAPHDWDCALIKQEITETFMQEAS